MGSGPNNKLFAALDLEGFAAREAYFCQARPAAMASGSAYGAPVAAVPGVDAEPPVADVPPAEGSSAPATGKAVVPIEPNPAAAAPTEATPPASSPADKK